MDDAFHLAVGIGLFLLALAFFREGPPRRDVERP
jgi:hypothetical protein